MANNVICSVSCVRFSPNVMNPVIVSAGWDKVVKVCTQFLVCECDAPPPSVVLGMMLEKYLLLQRANPL